MCIAQAVKILRLDFGCDIIPAPFTFSRSGGMADAADLKSAEGFLLYGFESRLRHHLNSAALRKWIDEIF